jgi:adenosylcobinamide-GDP ribazoletransferase
MRSLLAAIGTLTIVPLHHSGIASERDLGRSVLFFPLVGLAIGACLMGFAILLGPILSPAPLAALLLAVLALVTGGLHLDGLADLCDGLAAGGDRQRILAVMKDPHIGAFGVMGLGIVLILKYALFGEMIRRGWPTSFLLMGLLSRWAIVLATFFGRYAREAGTAQPFIGRIHRSQCIGATGIALAGTFLISKGIGLIAALLVFLSVLLFNRFLESRIGGWTGDALGALSEMVEVGVLIFISAAQSFVMG